MTEENTNIDAQNIETPEAVTEAPVQETPDVAPEIASPVVEETPVEIDDPTLGLGMQADTDDDLYYDDEPAIDYSKITDSFKAALKDTQPTRPAENRDVQGEERWVSSSELDVLKSQMQKELLDQFRQEQQQMLQQQRQEQQERNLTIQQYDSYVEKMEGSLEKAGINLSENELLKETVYSKLDSLIAKTQFELGRYLKPAEVQQVAQAHWRQVSPLIKSIAKPVTRPTQETLSPVSGGKIPSAEKALPPAQQEIEAYKQKAEQGEVDATETIRMLERLKK